METLVQSCNNTFYSTIGMPFFNMWVDTLKGVIMEWLKPGVGAGVGVSA